MMNETKSETKTLTIHFNGFQGTVTPEVGGYYDNAPGYRVKFGCTVASCECGGAVDSIWVRASEVDEEGTYGFAFATEEEAIAASDKHNNKNAIGRKTWYVFRVERGPKTWWYVFRVEPKHSPDCALLRELQKTKTCRSYLQDPHERVWHNEAIKEAERDFAGDELCAELARIKQEFGR